ncbi:alcohol dehydrogenase catalytic domain-containing protein [Diaminobutyricibacter tongyongensis]|uniref:Alcohol dehydrogenase catalytic domain-containing protein n=1 Tax=Leifsonia tongyongensis TaxID=1268043 RepID=A0A6L9XUX8_9MICO|nr:alcohol dehydrogenase catalytic domain-containing protein [Diaminobutyricibacter tongyongensis]NEN05106.1 alcohol dehydrogenase catalytic domain-containing protein [Diaminobutyricibacter tongyongensis]
MKAFVVRGPGDAGVEDVPEPAPAAGEVLIQVRRAGVCGTDVEFFTGHMQYLHDGHASYPIRLGHEWMGVVTAVGDGVDPVWVGRRVTGDTMLGCGRCYRCLDGRHHVCEFRTELGIRNGRPGALAERLAYPAAYLHPLPDSVDDAAGALVEPAGNALRSVRAAGLRPGDRALVLGAGTIGLLAAMFARAAGAEVHVMGRSGRSLGFARSLGFEDAWTDETLPELPWDAVIDASNAPHLPALALDLVEPGRRVVYVGLAGSPSAIDTRTLVLKDVTAVGILGGSQGLDGAIEAFANGSVDPRPLVAAVLPLDELAPVLDGVRPEGAGPGPKVHVALPGD